MRSKNTYHYLTIFLANIYKTYIRHLSVLNNTHTSYFLFSNSIIIYSISLYFSDYQSLVILCLYNIGLTSR